MRSDKDTYNICIYGGAFDPPHIGHLMGAQYLINSMNLDELWISPSGKRIDKQYKTRDENRLHLINLFLETLQAVHRQKSTKIHLFDKQLNNEIPSYGIDLVRYFLKYKKPHKADLQLYYAIGTDLCDSLKSWKDYDELKSLVKFVVLPKLSLVSPAEFKETKEVIKLHNEDSIVSSTKVRKFIAEGKSIYGLVPDSIYHHIVDNKLYRDDHVCSRKYISVREYEGWEYVQRINCDGVAVIAPVTRKNELILIEQYRPPVKRNVIELPAGLVGDSGKESFETAALRELQEETTYTTTLDKIEYITELPSSAGMTSETSRLYLAKDCIDTKRGQFGEEENGRIVKQFNIKLRNVKDFLKKQQEEGKLIDPKVYVALSYLR